MTITRLHKILHTLTLIMAVLPALILGSCINEEGLPCGVTEVPRSENTLVLKLSMNSIGTRALSDTHATVPALARENAIKNLTVFIFSDPNDDGINAAAETPIKCARYVEFDTPQPQGTQTELTFEVQVPQNSVEDGDRLVVFANMGDCTRLLTLGKLQSYIPEYSFIYGEVGKDCTTFAMSNAYSKDGVIHTTANSSQESRFFAELSLERLAARIDLDFTYKGTGDYAEYIETMEDGALYYEVRGKYGKDEHADLGSVYITHILPINVMQQPSYAIKHFSTGTESNFWENTRLGDFLKVDNNGHALEYVVEPATKNKPGSADSLTYWYGNTKAALAYDTDGFYTDKNHIRTRLAALATETLDKANAVILGYANENTQHTNYHEANVLTGLVIRAQFKPRMLITGYDAVNDKFTDSIPDAEIPRGTTIVRYTPAITTTSEGDVKYFALESDANAYATNHQADQATIKVFHKGVCYYHLWLKHIFNSGDTGGNPMAYGIVRNHVYRVSLSFKGIGREGALVETPDNVEATIAVRPWSVFTHEDIIM